MVRVSWQTVKRTDSRSNCNFAEAPRRRRENCVQRETWIGKWRPFSGPGSRKKGFNARFNDAQTKSRNHAGRATMRVSTMHNEVERSGILLQCPWCRSNYHWQGTAWRIIDGTDTMGEKPKEDMGDRFEACQTAPASATPHQHAAIPWKPSGRQAQSSPVRRTCAGLRYP